MKEQKVDGFPVVAPNGLLTGDEFTDLLELRLSELAAQPPALIVLDLTNVSGVNNNGLEVFDRVRHRCSVARGRLVLCGLNPRLKLTLKMAGLEERFDVCTTVADAAAALMRFRGEPA